MKLREYREALGISRAEAARQLKVNELTFYRWENGIFPRAEALRAIKKWSGGKVNPNDFLE